MILAQLVRERFLLFPSSYFTEEGGEEMNELLDTQMQPTNQDAASQPAAEAYERPQILVYGSLLLLARGSGSGDTDSCSSGYYDE